MSKCISITFFSKWSLYPWKRLHHIYCNMTRHNFGVSWTCHWWIAIYVWFYYIHFESVVILVIWLAFTGAIYSQIAPFYALDRSFSKAQQPLKFELRLDYRNQSNFRTMRDNFCNSLQTVLIYWINEIFLQTKMAKLVLGIEFAISKNAIKWWWNFLSYNFGLKSYLWSQITRMIPDQIALHSVQLPLFTNLIIIMIMYIGHCRTLKTTYVLCR